MGMLGAAIYLTELFSGYLVAVLIAGYVLLFEENGWLKRSAVKAVSLMVFFSFITVLIKFDSQYYESYRLYCGYVWR